MRGRREVRGGERGQKDERLQERSHVGGPHQTISGIQYTARLDWTSKSSEGAVHIRCPVCTWQWGQRGAAATCPHCRHSPLRPAWHARVCVCVR